MPTAGDLTAAEYFALCQVAKGFIGRTISKAHQARLVELGLIQSLMEGYDNAGWAHGCTPLGRFALAFELRRQAPCFEEDNGLIVIVARVRITRCRERNDAELCGSHSFGQSLRGFR